MMTDDGCKKNWQVVSPHAMEGEPLRYNVIRMHHGMAHYPFLSSVDYWTDKYLLGGEVSRSFWTGDDKNASGDDSNEAPWGSAADAAKHQPHHTES